MYQRSSMMHEVLVCLWSGGCEKSLFMTPPCPLISTITHYISSTLDSSLSSNQHLPVETWIKQFGSVAPKLYTIHQIPLF